MTQFIDIHSHIIPNVDDGSQSIETSLKLLRSACEEGITDVIATPHYMKEGVYRKKKEDIVPSFSLLRQAVAKEQLPIQLHLGNEVYCTEHMDALVGDEKVSTLANSKYVLVEFNFDSYSTEQDDMLYDLAVSGYHIIIAHPERYRYIQKNINMAYRWIKEGYLLQINQTSITNKEMKATYTAAKTLIENHYASFVASDAHGEHRPVTLRDAYDIVVEWCDETYADELFHDNAKKVLSNQFVAVPEVEPIEEKQNIFSKLFRRNR